MSLLVTFNDGTGRALSADVPNGRAHSGQMRRRPATTGVHIPAGETVDLARVLEVDDAMARAALEAEPLKSHFARGTLTVVDPEARARDAKRAAVENLELVAEAVARDEASNEERAREREAIAERDRTEPLLHPIDSEDAVDGAGTSDDGNSADAPVVPAVHHQVAASLPGSPAPVQPTEPRSADTMGGAPAGPPQGVPAGAPSMDWTDKQLRAHAAAAGVEGLAKLTSKTSVLQAIRAKETKDRVQASTASDEAERSEGRGTKR